MTSTWMSMSRPRSQVLGPLTSHQNTMKLHSWLVLIPLSLPSLSLGSVIINAGFDTGSLVPWYVDRVFGTNRGWNIGGIDPQSGSYYAFNAGRIELRQNFTPVLGNEITSFSFFVTEQFANRGNPWIEVFYADGTSTGLQDVVLDPLHATGGTNSGWIWDEIDLLPYVDKSRGVSGVSIVGIPSNTLCVDTFTLATVPEPLSSSLVLTSLAVLLPRRRRVNKEAHGCNVCPMRTITRRE